MKAWVCARVQSHCPNDKINPSPALSCVSPQPCCLCSFHLSYYLLSSCVLPPCYTFTVPFVFFLFGTRLLSHLCSFSLLHLCSPVVFFPSAAFPFLPRLCSSLLLHFYCTSCLFPSCTSTVPGVFFNCFSTLPAVLQLSQFYSSILLHFHCPGCVSTLLHFRCPSCALPSCCTFTASVVFSPSNSSIVRVTFSLTSALPLSHSCVFRLAALPLSHLCFPCGTSSPICFPCCTSIVPVAPPPLPPSPSRGSSVVPVNCVFLSAALPLFHLYSSSLLHFHCSICVLYPRHNHIPFLCQTAISRWCCMSLSYCIIFPAILQTMLQCSFPVVLLGIVLIVFLSLLYSVPFAQTRFLLKRYISYETCIFLFIYF